MNSFLQDPVIGTIVTWLAGIVLAYAILYAIGRIISRGVRDGILVLSSACLVAMTVAWVAALLFPGPIDASLASAGAVIISILVSREQIKVISEEVVGWLSGLLRW